MRFIRTIIGVWHRYLWGRVGIKGVLVSVFWTIFPYPRGNFPPPVFEFRPGVTALKSEHLMPPGILI